MASGGEEFPRSDRQVLFRLPRNAVEDFSIQTFVLQLDKLDPAQRQSLAEAILKIG